MRRLASWLSLHRRLQLGMLLGGPLAWMVLAYLGSLSILLLSAFWDRDPFTGQVQPFAWSLDAFESLISNPVYRTIAFRTLLIAAAVTITDALLAFPIAYYMARVASPRVRRLPRWNCRGRARPSARERRAQGRLSLAPRMRAGERPHARPCLRRSGPGPNVPSDKDRPRR